jgi:hypothetical protein
VEPVINRRLWTAFERRLAVEALIGDGDFFVPNVTYREHHNRPLALRQLAIWAQERSASATAEKAIVQAVRQLIRQARFEDAIDLVWSLIILWRANDVKLPISPGRFRSLMNDVIESGSVESLSPQSRATLESIREAARSYDLEQDPPEQE